MIIYILLDAFRGDYLSEKTTPFLHSLVNDKKNYAVKYVKPSHSFCERTEIFSGIGPLESGYFTALGNNPNLSPFKNYKYFFKILHLIEKLLFRNSLFIKIYRKLFSILFSHIGIKMKIYNIPFNELHNYYLTEDYDDIRNHSFKSNIFNTIRKYDLSSYFETFTSLRDKISLSDEERMDLVIENLNNDIVFLYIGGPDQKGHAHGPETPVFNTYLSELDKKLGLFINDIDKKTNNQSTIILNGDHGMSQVKFLFNGLQSIEKFLKSYNFTKNIDYKIFLDSTLIRLWSYNVELLNLVKSNQDLKEFGSFVYSNSEPEFRYTYGDIIWTINKGGLIIPNYFQKTKINGMHGYIPENKDDWGTLIIKNPKGLYFPKESIDLVEINNILKNEIESRY